MGKEKKNQKQKADARSLLHEIYAALGRGAWGEARSLMEELAPLEPGEAASLLVSSYVEEGDARGAKEAWKSLEDLRPDAVDTRFLRARIFFMDRELGKALELLEPLSEDGVLSREWQEKVWNLMGQCYRLLGDSRRSTKCYLRASRAAVSPELGALEYSNYLFNLHYLPPLPPAKAREEARGYDAFFRKVPRFYHRWREKAERKLRVGYLSPDFRNHVVLRFSYALLTGHDRERFQVFAYMSGVGDDVSRRLAGQVDGWRDVSRCTPAETARVIYEDGIDILMDLSGHTRGSCLPVLACRPAPVQLSGIGYFASTGLATVDYFLGDVFLDDEGTEEEFTEELLLLPQSHFCYTPFRGDVPVGEAPCLEKGCITFGSFNNFTKANDDVLTVWGEILGRLPGARLLLKASAFDGEDSRKAALGRMAAAGIELSRVELRGATEEYLLDYGDVDIALDTFPYPGGGTTCDALYMGVPVVTLKGGSHGGRFGWSIMQNLGLGELCALSREDYVEKALMLAGDREFLGLLRKNLRPMMTRSPLMDRREYMKAVEQGYEMIWERFLRGQKGPKPAEVPRCSMLLDEMRKAGEREQALAVADALLEVGPDSPKLAEKLAIFYLEEEEADRAERAASLLPPASLLGRFLRGRALCLKGRAEEAEELCLDILGRGGLPYPWGGAERNLLAEIYKRRGWVEKAAAEYRAACEAKRPPSSVAEDWSNYLLLLQYLPKPREFLFREARRGAKWYGKGREFFGKRAGHPGGKIRVGYLSPDFHRHVVACFSQAFFEGADRSRFEVYGYAKCREDSVSRRMAGHADVWRNVYGKEPEEIAGCIREDGIDILVELAGHMGKNSLPVLALRPAPIQICGIGYFSTTGLPFVDYFLVDETTAPPGEEKFFTEKLLRLPHSHFCYKQVLEVPEVGRMPFEEKGFITFGSMNNVNKLGDQVVEVWGRILEALPDARLYLKSAMLEDGARRERELARLERAGISPSRVTLEGFTGEYLSEYRRMDIALDTFPYPGGGTTCDALYMGVPVISLAGASNHERFGLSILSNLGLGELCGRNAEEYVACALRLAGNPERLRELHGTLRGRMERSPVMDQGHYMRELEKAYEDIWRDRRT